mmetsp:Transcript_25846/g.54392  ORF Transcript_25846/g.54392 Transcript_25846/m.54392 type:complete len:117 (-) Transcript_25846:488-838(-)
MADQKEDDGCCCCDENDDCEGGIPDERDENEGPSACRRGKRCWKGNSDGRFPQRGGCERGGTVSALTWAWREEEGRLDGACLRLRQFQRHLNVFSIFFEAVLPSPSPSPSCSSTSS